MVKHRPRKRFGQNFLQNQSIITRIIDSFSLQRQDNVVEIGPGMGALTKLLLGQLDSLHAIEIDTDLQAHLRDCFPDTTHFKLIAGDALAIDYHQFGNNLRILGNLPYNISTPLLLHLSKYIDVIKDMHFMLQKEVVMRMVGTPGNKAYGRLSVMLQYHFEMTHLFDVPPEAFHPQPKVDSAIVRLVPHKKCPFEKVNVSVLEKLVAMAFSMRRKTLANNLKPIISATQLAEIGIDPTDRPEQISVEDFVRLSNLVQNLL